MCGLAGYTKPKLIECSIEQDEDNAKPAHRAALSEFRERHRMGWQFTRMGREECTAHVPKPGGVR
jgi:hypothetical protein